MKEIKVLIIDDSALIRELLKEIFSKDAELKVVATAGDPYIAVERIKTYNPDVITLDIEMPKMDGLTFLEKLMQSRPTPVVMISSLTERNCDITLKALAKGAVDFITKPKINISNEMNLIEEEIIDKVKNAASANIKKITAPKDMSVPAKFSSDAILSLQKRHSGKQTSLLPLIAIGASTGGTIALTALLKNMPKESPGIAIVQHMPEKFTESFANRLDEECEINVREAKNGDDLCQGLVLIAPGGKHMLIQKGTSNYYVQVKDGPLVNRHKPSVDVLFRSAANSAGSNAVGVILTGMGADGAQGMKEMKDAGAYNIAEDESSCVVFGMPKAAIEEGGVDMALPLDRIPDKIVSIINKKI